MGYHRKPHGRFVFCPVCPHDERYPTAVDTCQASQLLPRAAGTVTFPPEQVAALKAAIASALPLPGVPVAWAGVE